MLRRKQYVALYRESVSTDPYTGKQKRVNVYVGPWYEMSVDAEQKRRLCALLLVLCALSVAVFAACGFLNTAGSRCFYVLPFYLLLPFPLFYGCYGAVRLARQKPRFTEVDRDEGLDRARTSALGAAILAALHTLGEVVLMCLGGAKVALAREIVCTLGIALAGACALAAFMRLRRLEAVRLPDEGGQAPKNCEPSPNPAK